MPTPDSKLDQLLRTAIEQTRLLQLRYRNKNRIIEPHDYGQHNGIIKRLTWEIGGSSSCPLPNWRWMETGQISDAQLLDQTFPGSRPTPSDKHHTPGVTSLDEERRQARYRVALVYIRTDSKFEHRHALQINCEVLDFCYRTLRAEIPLLANNLCARSTLRGRPTEYEFLRPLHRPFFKPELDATHRNRLVENQPDVLLPALPGPPARPAPGEDRFDVKARIFRSHFHGRDLGQVLPPDVRVGCCRRAVLVYYPLPHHAPLSTLPHEAAKSPILQNASWKKAASERTYTPKTFRPEPHRASALRVRAD